MSTDQNQPAEEAQETHPKQGGGVVKLIVLAAVAALIGFAYWKFGNQETLNWIAEQETSLKQQQQNNPLLVFGLAFLAYVVVTGLSLPGAALMTLLMGWYFGWGPGTLLVSFASTTGATAAFLLSRYLFQNSIQQKFGDKIATFNDALEREGAFYLFTLRLIPAVPFFVINVVMGLTKMRVWTYWWVSQLGMLAGTAVYCYAGSQVPDLKTLINEGAGAVFTPARLTQIAIAFTLLGVFPLAAKKLIGLLKPQSGSEAASKNGAAT